ncbi:hypothetical protein M441DRAFT_151936 [Trichoderma asperellum CBS 433.97]|uniref:Uncharacterized protein n=1 Tax=Trichoderma asperellum (strain ATCC 204424 / CBS 433.97 / NBRC 101777) TaxID=1042311 RepID=A0A2T3YTT6_TRIA4|nr:hypothetical protein M441DRAFT_151936 [Trichoderma asperellum CBS 433.97]PTB35978.1 hypothetical protein M441DRAFT_151936 [Trichoderma asperellum CBS 433.97]
MKNLVHTISHALPARQATRTNKEYNQLAADYDHLALSLQETHSELQQTDSELQQAYGELHRANSEVRQHKDSLHHYEAELYASQCEVLRLQDKERSMRDFLIENSHNKIISDRDVREKFTQLRQRIQWLASNKAYNIEEFHNLKLNESWFEPRYIEALWGESPKPGRLVILRSLMFHFLNVNILDKLLFDINDANGSPSLAGVGSSIPSLGQAFSLFERVISDRGVNHDMLVNWRLSTFKCIEAAGLGGTDADFGVIDGDAMFDCFQRFISEKATVQQIERLRNAYRELCKEAWTLRLLMRNSLEPFECYVSRGYQLGGLEALYEVIGEISHVSGMTGEFAFPIFGALIKHAKIHGEGFKILEKAQCIMAVPST